MQNIGAVILAAGASWRFGQPKQLLHFGGQSLVHRVVDRASEAGCEPIGVVIGSYAEKVKAELRDTRAKIFENHNWPAGIGGSIRAGVRGLIEMEPRLSASALLACDQPFRRHGRNQAALRPTREDE